MMYIVSRDHDAIFQAIYSGDLEDFSHFLSGQTQYSVNRLIMKFSFAHVSCSKGSHIYCLLKTKRKKKLVLLKGKEIRKKKIKL